MQNFLDCKIILANQYGCIVLEVVYSFAEAGAGSVNREYQLVKFGFLCIME